MENNDKVSLENYINSNSQKKSFMDNFKQDKVIKIFVLVKGFR